MSESAAADASELGLSLELLAESTCLLAELPTKWYRGL
jgi:hypothetical protein